MYTAIAAYCFIEYIFPGGDSRLKGGHMLALDTAPDLIETPTELMDTVSEISSDYHIPAIIIAVTIALLIFIAAKIFTSVIGKSIRKLPNRSAKFSPMMASLLSRICSVLIWIIAIVSILGVFGIDLTPVLAGLGITGVILGFALQESISSLFSGVMIAVNNPFCVGDFISIGELEGTVISMDLMCVTLITEDARKVTLNNKSVWGATIINQKAIDSEMLSPSFNGKRRLDFPVSIRYTDDPDKARKAIAEFMESIPEVLSEPAPYAGIVEYGSSSIVISARGWVLPENYWKVYWAFNNGLLPFLHENGLDMPYSQVVVHLDGQP